MNLQQVVQPRSAANGFGRRRVEKEMGSRPENKSLSSKTNPVRFTNAGVPTGSQGGGSESPSRERLLYLTTCLIGHHVEVQVKDGSLLSGIFHAANAQEDFGVILKMARSIKGASSRWQKAVSDSLSNTPSKILIIPANELVQIMTKDVSVTRDGLTNELQCVKPQDIMIDSSISQSRHVEVERELGRWVPDEDDSECPELENIFDGHWNRGWNQFEANEALFGVKSTFDEDLYTTKLERGPQMRELEKEASRIAREIEGEETKDLHLAEERGMHLHEDFDIDEETRFSSVFRGIDDSGYDENEDIVLDSCNNETFGGTSDSIVSRPFADLTSGKSNDGAVVPSSSSVMDEVQCSLSSTGRDLNGSGSNDPAIQFTKTFSPLDGESRVQENQNGEEDAEKKMLGDEAQMSKSVRAKKDGSDIGGLSPNATAYAPSYHVPSKGQEKSTPPSELSEDTVVVKTQGTTQSINSRGRPGSATSSTSDCGRSASASRGPDLSPSSSVGSLSSEKSTLNPHAKEFKLNPNAKSFMPSQTPLRPASPVSDGSFYFPPNIAPVPHMHGMPVGIGMGPSFAGHQPVMFNPQAAPMQSPQAYFHPNGPQFGQQMILGHPRNVLYMPTYPPEMPYKGREF